MKESGGVQEIRQEAQQIVRSCVYGVAKLQITSDVNQGHAPIYKCVTNFLWQDTTSSKLKGNHATGVRNSRSQQPIVPHEEFLAGVLKSLGGREVFDSTPCDTARGVGTRTAVAELRVVASVQCPGTFPRQPTIWLDDVVNETLHVDGLSVLLPRPAQVGFELCLDRNIGLVGCDGAVLENQARH